MVKMMVMVKMILRVMLEKMVMVIVKMMVRVMVT